MPIKNNAAPGGQTGNGVGQISFDGFSKTMSKSNTNTAPRKNQFHIEDFLLRGADNALPIRILVDMTGLVPRKITAAVQDARRRGVPVLSSASPGGYFIADNEEERQRCLRSLRHRKAELSWTEFCLENATIDDAET